MYIAICSVFGIPAYLNLSHEVFNVDEIIPSSEKNDLESWLFEE